MRNRATDGHEFFKDARTDLSGPLHGLRVVEVTSTFAGPRCGALLADYGADVIKVERRCAPDVVHRLPPFIETTDPPQSFLDAAVNRNKRNIFLDLQHEQGREVFLAMCRRADIVIENLRAGTMCEWRCGYRDVRAVNERVIYVSITGYGQYGPYVDRGAYDPMAQSMSGVMWLNATGDAPPLKSPLYLADELAGMHAALAVLAAIRHRDCTGEGQHIDVSLLDSMIASSTGIPTLAANGLPTPRLGNIYPFSAPANVYRCSDGWVYAGVLLDTHWRVLSEMLGRPELGNDPNYATIPGRVARRPEVDELLAGWCRTRTRGEVVEQFEQAGLTAAAILSPQEMVDDPHIEARETIQPVKHACGATSRVESSPAKMSRTPIRLRRAAPKPGADTEEVLAELGLDDSQMQRLREAGVI